MKIRAFFGSYNVSLWHGNNLLRCCAQCDYHQKTVHNRKINPEWVFGTVVICFFFVLDQNTVDNKKLHCE